MLHRLIFKILCISLFLHVWKIYTAGCDEIHNFIRQEFEVIFEEIEDARSLIVDYNKNYLYFTCYDIDDKKRVTARVNLKDGRSDKIENVPNGLSLTIDREKGNVYIGGCNGVYQTSNNQSDNYAKLYAGNKSCIQSVFHKNILYYTNFPELGVYTVRELGKDEKFEDLNNTSVQDLVIDEENVIYYYNDSGFYIQELGKGTDAATVISYDQGVACLNTDARGDVYACLRDGIYKVDKIRSSLTRIIEIEKPLGMAFDGCNSLIYSDASRIIRMRH